MHPKEVEMRSVKFVLMVFIIAAVLTACTTGSPESPVEVPLPDTVSLPSPSPVLSQEDLKSKWTPAVSTSLMLQGLCPLIAEVVEQRLSGTLSDEDFVNDFFAHGIGLGYTEKLLSEWQAVGIQMGYKQILSAHKTLVSRAYLEWFEAKIPTGRMVVILDEECAAFSRLYLIVGEAALKDGVTVETISEISTEDLDKFEVYIGEITTPSDD
jgi:hypothetical protein